MSQSPLGALCLEKPNNAGGDGWQHLRSMFVGGHGMIMAFLIPRLALGYDFCVFWEIFFYCCFKMNDFCKPQQISLGLQNCYKIGDGHGETQGGDLWRRDLPEQLQI